MLATPWPYSGSPQFLLLPPHEKILIAEKRPGFSIVITWFLQNLPSDYRCLFDFLKTPCLAKPVEIVWPRANYYILAYEEEIRTFFANSIKETISFKDRVMELLDEETEVT